MGSVDTARGGSAARGGAGSADRRSALVAATAIAVIIADQVSKHWALDHLTGGRTVDVVGSLRFNLAFNTGTAFSIGSDLNVGPFVAVLALGIVAWLLFSGATSRPVGALAAGLVAGGAVGNLVDRALRSGPYGEQAGFMGGAVVDFIDLQWWPIFNIADMGIVGGAVGLVLASFLDLRDETDEVAVAEDPVAEHR